MVYAHNPTGKVSTIDRMIGLSQIMAGDKLFFILSCEHDFGASVNAVATKITDSAPEDGEIVAGIFILTEAKAGGSGNDVTKFAKEAAGTTAMTGTLTLTMLDDVYLNHVSSVTMVLPHATEANRRFAKGDDIFVYTDAQALRSAGIYQAYLICKRI